MPVFSVRILWAQGSRQASEQYWTPNLSVSAATQAASAFRIQTLIAARAGMMFETQRFKSISIADTSNPRLAWLLRPGNNPWPTRESMIAVPDVGLIALSASRQPEQIRVGVTMELSFDGGVNSSRRTISSVPDDVTSYDDVTVLRSKAAYWWQAFEAFRQQLVGGWQMKTKDDNAPNAPVPVRGLVVMAAAPSLIGIEIETGATPAEWDKGTIIDLSAFVPSATVCPCPSINGRWTIHSRNDVLSEGYTIFYLLDSAGMDITEWKRMGTAQRVVMEFVPLIDARITGTTTRKRGGTGPRAGRPKIRCCPR